ncbi:MAG: diguanylate cyclase [Actinomycetota bacterium]|nr:diguanylate cyclase [Actinomycetota bacterium]
MLGEPSKILGGLPDPVLLVDRHGIIEWANPATEDQLGHRLGDWQGNNVLEAIHPDDLGLALTAFQTISQRPGDESGLLLSARVRHGDGTWIPVELRGRALDLAGQPRLIIIARNVADRHRVAIDGGDPLLLRALVHHSSAVLVLLDDAFRIRSASSELTRLLGHDLLAVQGRELVSLLAPSDREAVRNCLMKLDPVDGQALLEADFTTIGGGRTRLSLTISDLRQDEVINGLLISGVDVTTLRDTEAALRRMAELDPLTGLLNRAALMNRVHVYTRSVEPVPLAVLFCDLDGFKAVNDVLGHATGDLILQDVASRLQRCVHSGDLLARLGGDEFVVILHDCDAAGAQIVADRIQDAINEPFLPMGNFVSVGMSIGIACADEWHSVEPLLESADAAMYEVKRSRRA